MAAAVESAHVTLLVLPDHAVVCAEVDVSCQCCIGRVIFLCYYTDEFIQLLGGGNLIDLVFLLYSRRMDYCAREEQQVYLHP